MKRTAIKRKTKLKAGKPIKAKKRSASDFARVYGSKARVEFVKSLPCVACNATPSDNAHIKSGGMGRKADYTDIVPLCSKCHTLQHQRGWKALGLSIHRLQYFAFYTQWQWAERDSV